MGGRGATCSRDEPPAMGLSRATFITLSCPLFVVAGPFIAPCRHQVKRGSGRKVGRPAGTSRSTPPWWGNFPAPRQAFQRPPRAFRGCRGGPGARWDHTCLQGGQFQISAFHHRWSSRVKEKGPPESQAASALGPTFWSCRRRALLRARCRGEGSFRGSSRRSRSRWALEFKLALPGSEGKGPGLLPASGHEGPQIL